MATKIEEKRISIVECQHIGKERYPEPVEFMLCGPNGKTKCKWFDVHFGYFKADDGYLTMQEVLKCGDLWCVII